MKSLLLTIAICVMAQVSYGQAKKDTVTILTSSICEMCKRTIEEDLAFEKGVVFSNLDLETKMLTVVYKPKQTDPDKIRTRINEIGYDADSTKAYPIAVERLPECCKPGSIFHKDN